MPNSPAQKPKALIIDDEKDICYLLSSILRQRNFHAKFAGSIGDAETIVSSDCEYAVIFLDNHLPDGFGVDYIKTLKTKCSNSVLVMITAHDTISDRNKAHAEGIDFFIGKPFSKEAIFKTLEGIAVAK
jgi:two-component system, OmpR family, response regulator